MKNLRIFLSKIKKIMLLMFIILVVSSSFHADLLRSCTCKHTCEMLKMLAFAGQFFLVLTRIGSRK